MGCEGHAAHHVPQPTSPLSPNPSPPPAIPLSVGAQQFPLPLPPPQVNGGGLWLMNYDDILMGLWK